MANQLPKQKIEQMWRAFQNVQSAQHVSKMCSVSRATVDRYRRVERWDERLAGIRRGAQSKADYGLAKAMAQSLEMIRTLKAKYAKAIEGKDVGDDDVSVVDLERLVRLEAFVMGGSESRHEVIDHRFVDWSEEELEAYALEGKRPSRPSGGTARA